MQGRSSYRCDSAFILGTTLADDGPPLLDPFRSSHFIEFVTTLKLSFFLGDEAVSFRNSTAFKILQLLTNYSAVRFSSFPRGSPSPPRCSHCLA